MPKSPHHKPPFPARSYGLLSETQNRTSVSTVNTQASSEAHLVRELVNHKIEKPEDLTLELFQNIFKISCQPDHEEIQRLNRNLYWFYKRLKADINKASPVKNLQMKNRVQNVSQNPSFSPPPKKAKTAESGSESVPSGPEVLAGSNAMAMDVYAQKVARLPGNHLNTFIMTTNQTPGRHCAY